MSIVSVQPKSFILALLIRDDGERFLLGDNGYDFKDSQLHFAANTIENDEVQKQGADGVMVAGQVRRASVQSFDGYVGDATMAKETIEQMRRDFFAFFVKGHHFRVIYVDCNRNAWQRKGGYLVDAPEVKELWQIHPEYHVGLNFEDVNYYSYDEDADGNEILANLVNVPVSIEVSGGLVWDEDGAVSEDASDISYDTETADATPAKNVYITDAAEAPLASFKLDGETSQTTYTGKNLFNLATPGTNNGVTVTANSDGSFNVKGTTTGVAVFNFKLPVPQPAGTYTFSCKSENQAMPSGGNFFLRARKSDMSMLVPSGNTSQLQGNDTYYNSATFTSTDEMYYVALNLTKANVTYDMIIYPQLELGSTATSFEPYVGGVASPNPEYPQAVQTVTGENVVKICGKNLFDKNSISTGYLNADGTLSSDQAYKTSDFIAVKPNTAYYKTYTASPRTKYYNSTRQPLNTTTYQDISIGGAAGTFTTPANAAYVRFSFPVAGINLDTTQLELGSTATTYEPYQGQSYTISLGSLELCKIGTYQDYIYKSGGKWYKHKAIKKSVFDQNSGWTKNQYGTNSYNVKTKDIFTAVAEIGVVSPQFIAKSYNGRTDAVNNIIFADSNDGMATGQRGISVRNTSWNDLTSFTTWLTSNSITAYYVLATATEEEITNEALIAQLDALLTTARTFAGINNIFTITPNEQGTLEISYYTKYQPMVGSGGYVWEAGGAGGPTVIMNNSIDSVSPVWTIYGPTTNPQLENATTGETIEYVGTIAQGQTLTIDMGEQTASLDGLNVISNLVGDFIQLAPGRNNIIYSVSGEAGASELGWSEIVG